MHKTVSDKKKHSTVIKKNYTFNSKMWKTYLVVESGIFADNSRNLEHDTFLNHYKSKKLYIMKSPEIKPKLTERLAKTDTKI